MNRIVVKVGTGVLLGEDGNLSQGKFDLIAREAAILTSWGIEIILVSSGAIKAGHERIGEMKFGLDIGKKEFAGIGARHLLNQWGNAFANHACEIAQIWVTHANVTDTYERASVASSIISYTNTGRIVPLINENDVVSDKEIRMMENGLSENDMLARLIAEMVGADGILFLTEIGGVFNEDLTRKYKVASKEVLDRLLASADHKKNPSKEGTGGIIPKLIEALKCFDSGINAAIAGLEDDAIEAFIRGESKGTTLGPRSMFWL